MIEPTILNGTSTTLTVVLTAVPAKLATAQPEMSDNQKQINKILITSTKYIISNTIHTNT